MKRFIVPILLSALVAVLFSGIASAQITRVAIGQIILDDPGAATAVEEAARRELASQNLEVVARGQEDYIVNIYHKGTDYRRTFNWWFLLFPLWPVIGVTESHVTVYVQSQAVNDAGRIAWQGSGEASASTVLFSDFRYPGQSGPLAEAAGRSLRGAGSLVSAKPFVDVAYSEKARLGFGMAF